MTMPFRDWTLFDRTSLRGGPSPANNFNSPAQWSDVHVDNNTSGWSRLSTGYYRWDQLWRPHANFEAVTSLDNPCSCNIELNCFPPAINQPLITEFQLIAWLLEESNKWDSTRVTGRHYDGVNEWDDYPHKVAGRGDPIVVTVTDLPKIYNIWVPAYFTSTVLPLKKDAFFKNGVIIKQSNYLPADPPGWDVGNQYEQTIYQVSMRVRFFNPVVNSMSRYDSPIAGGVEIILTGLGFNNSDADIEEGGNANPAGWNDLVSHIYFIGLQGQGTTTIKLGDGDFTVDSNEQITIPSMEPLAAGTYEIKVEKNIQGTVSYAGDYSCDSEGRVSAAERFTLLAGDILDMDDPETPIILTKWRFKKFDGTFAFKNWSPIDTYSPSVFYDGRLKNISGLSRKINDDTGLYISPDLQFEIANTDKEISKILSEHYVKDEPIDIFIAFKNYPESYKTQVFRAYIEDIQRKGDLVSFDTRDVTTVYFNQKVPRYRITTAEFPYCHQNFVNKPMPEGLGLGSYIASEASGYMEAAYVDTRNGVWRFLAARASLKAVDEVYKDGIGLNAGADYSIVIADGGRTYIDLTADPESSKITFNFKGYIYAPWNSANGYVQHPVYILLFYLALIMEIPIEYIDIDSFKAVKDILDSFDSGIATSGHLGIQQETNSETIIKELLLSIGAVFFPDMRGRLKLMKKDITNIATTKYIYAQIDTFNHPEESWGLKEATNRVKGVWNFVPAAGVYQSSKTEEREESILAFCGHIQEDPGPREMKWITNSALAGKMITDTLFKRGSGQKTFKFDVHLINLTGLDIYTNFRLQDPFGISSSGKGYVGRYCYIEGIDYDWPGNKMSIIAQDLGYLLRAYLMLGSEDDHQDNWSSASDEDKTFAYLCLEATGKFANGEKGKKLVSESYMG